MKLKLLLLAISSAVLSFGAQSGTAIPGGDYSTTYVIKQTGAYYLAGNRTMTDLNKPAIEIKVPDVTIDLNGYNLRFKAGTGTGVGILATAMDNIEIKGGSITTTPVEAIRLTGPLTGGTASGARLIDVRISGCGKGVSCENMMSVWVERCQFDTISGIGLGVSANGAGGASVRNSQFSFCPTGVRVYGDGVVEMINNVFNPCGVGIDLGTAGPSVRIEGNTFKVFTAGVAAGVNSQAIVRDNQFFMAGNLGVVFLDDVSSVSGFRLVENNFFQGPSVLRDTTASKITFRGNRIDNSVVRTGQPLSGTDIILP